MLKDIMLCATFARLFGRSIIKEGKLRLYLCFTTVGDYAFKPVHLPYVPGNYVRNLQYKVGVGVYFKSVFVVVDKRI